MAAVVLLAAGLLAWLGTSGGAAPRARQYLAFTACLLTGPGGLGSAQAARVWQGMEDASLATRAKVEYLPVMSGDSAGAAAPYLASLLQRHCNVVVATGRPEAAAVTAAAPAHPGVRFAVVGGPAPGRQVTEVPAARVRAGVDALITSAVNSSA